MAYIFDLSDAWTGGAAFTAIKMNVTDGGSTAGSLLMDLQVGGSSKFSVTKAGVIGGSGYYLVTNALSHFQGRFAGASDGALGANGAAWSVGGTLGFTTLNNATGVNDLKLERDAANTLAQRNGVNAQAFNLYNTYTDASNYERGFMRFVSNVLEIGTQAAGTGNGRDVSIKTQSGRYLTLSNGTTLDSNAVYTRFYSGGAAVANINSNSQQIVVSSNGSFTFSSGADSFTTPVDTGIARAAAGVLRINNASTGGGAMQLTEMTAPAAPATDNVRIYAEDDGAGKTRLMARFATGAAVQIAIEP